jgi:predicted transcriptional regulator
MFTRFLPTVARTATTRSVSRFGLVYASRGFSTVGVTASDAAELSGYNKIDFTIDEDSTVLEAVQRFVAHNIGCLVTVNSKGTYFV